MKKAEHICQGENIHNPMCSAFVSPFVDADFNDCIFYVGFMLYAHVRKICRQVFSVLKDELRAVVNFIRIAGGEISNLLVSSRFGEAKRKDTSKMV